MQRVYVHSNFFSDSLLSWVQVPKPPHIAVEDEHPLYRRLNVEGEAANRDAAPVVICAPHTSFLGSFKPIIF